MEAESFLENVGGAKLGGADSFIDKSAKHTVICTAHRPIRLEVLPRDAF